MGDHLKIKSPKTTNYSKVQGRLFDVDEEDANVTFAIEKAVGQILVTKKLTL